MNRNLVVVLMLAVAGVTAGAYVKRARARSERVWPERVYQSTCNLEAGKFVEARCLRALPAPAALVREPDLGLLSTRDISVVAVAPLACPLRKGDLFRGVHVGRGPIWDLPADHVLVTLPVDRARTPPGLVPGAEVDIYRRPGAGTTTRARLLARGAVVAQVNGNACATGAGSDRPSIASASVKVPASDAGGLVGDRLQLVITGWPGRTP